MNTLTTSEILSKLERREPLFKQMPSSPRDYKKSIISGTESEYGVLDKNGEPDAHFHLLPIVAPNGSRIYRDCDHVEYASCETTNAVAATAYYEAGKVICQRAGYADRLFCHNNDWVDGVSFAHHENYSIRTPWINRLPLIPFLVVRSLVSGAGWVNNKREFEITQRASFLKTAVGPDACADRAILNTRYKPLTDVLGLDRLHLICGDAHMSEVSTFLTIGLTALMVELLERKALPNIGYDNDLAIVDMRAVSLSTRDWSIPKCWPLRGVMNGPKEALELLQLFVEQAKTVFGGRDVVTDTILVVAKDTLEKLAREPETLWGRLDWISKWRIITDFKRKEGNDFEWFKSQDLEYHDINPERDHYYFLKRKGWVERIITDEMINSAADNPPEDTRASVRGKTVKLLRAEDRNREIAAHRPWDMIMIVDAKANRPPNSERFHSDSLKLYWKEEIGDPFNPYHELFWTIQKRIAGSNWKNRY